MKSKISFIYQTFLLRNVKILLKQKQKMIIFDYEEIVQTIRLQKCTMKFQSYGRFYYLLSGLLQDVHREIFKTFSPKVKE